jgi:hypothetical protein
VIFKSDGAEDFGVLSIAFSSPCPYVLEMEARGAIAAAMAALLINDLLELDIKVGIDSDG